MTKTKKAIKKKLAPPKPLPQRGAKKRPIETEPATVPQIEPATKKPTKKELKAANEALQDAAAAAKDAPHIEARLHVGELSVLVDASSLEHTLGCGRWGGGLGLLDSWPDTVWAGLLAHLGLPAFPLDRAMAEKPVRRLVQRLWYEAVQGGVPQERVAVWNERDAEAQETYKQEQPKIATATKEKSERARTSFGKSRGGITTYIPTDALKKASVGGQAAVLLAAFKAAKWAAMTTQQATEGMLKAGLKTATKPERIAAFYLCQWVKKSLLTRGTAEAAE